MAHCPRLVIFSSTVAFCGVLTFISLILSRSCCVLENISFVLYFLCCFLVHSLLFSCILFPWECVFFFACILCVVFPHSLIFILVYIVSLKMYRFCWYIFCVVSSFTRCYSHLYCFPDDVSCFLYFVCVVFPHSLVFILVYIVSLRTHRLSRVTIHKFWLASSSWYNFLFKH